MSSRTPDWRARWRRHTEVHESAYELIQATAHHPEPKCAETGHGAIKLSISKSGSRSRFLLSAAFANSALAVTLREDGTAQAFDLIRRGRYWESINEVPQPHRFRVVLFLGHGGHAHSFRTRFVELPSLVVSRLEAPRSLKKSSVAHWLSRHIIAADSHDRSIRSPYGP